MSLTIKLSGTYCDPTGQPLPLTTVKFEAQQNSNQTFVALTTQTTTDIEGNYSIGLVPNMYLVTSGSRNSESVLGFITINADSPDGTLNEYLTSFVSDSSTPGMLKEMEEILEETKEVASNAGVNPCGAFDASQLYHKNDLVEYEGSEYRATSDAVGVIPPSAPWEIFISAGSPGPANVLTIGTVETVGPDEPASATITGEAPNQVLNLKIPQGQSGEGSSIPEFEAPGFVGFFSVSTVETGVFIRPGTEMAASDLTYSGVSDPASIMLQSYSSPSGGTWRCAGFVACQGQAASTGVTLFQRVDNLASGRSGQQLSISDCVYSKENNLMIDCILSMNGRSRPFSACKYDVMPWGREIYDNAVAGSYGEVHPYVPKVVT